MPRRKKCRHRARGEIFLLTFLFIGHFGRTRFRGLSGQRAAHQEPARTQERCAGKPVAAKTAHLRIVEQFVPTSFEDSCLAHLLAATRATREWSGDLHSTNAESADADEHTISECDQRSERSDWTDDRTGHRRLGTRSARACGTQASPATVLSAPKHG